MFIKLTFAGQDPQLQCEAKRPTKKNRIASFVESDIRELQDVK